VKLLRLRRRHPERDIDDLRRQSDQRELGWDAELADEHGRAWHDWPDRPGREDHPGSEPRSGGGADGDSIDVTDASTGAPRPAGPRHRRRR